MTQNGHEIINVIIFDTGRVYSFATITFSVNIQMKNLYFWLALLVPLSLLRTLIALYC